MSARIIMKLQVVRREEWAGGVTRFAFRHSRQHKLPVWEAGAHVDVHLPDGKVRQYSLVGDPSDSEVYEIAVRRDQDGRGGSAFICDRFAVGDIVHISAPRNNFPLHDDARPAIFIAGGIGVTPMISMARALQARQTPFEFHYCADETAPFRAVLEDICLPGQLNCHLKGALVSSRMDVAAEIARAAPDSIVYCCGPDRLIAAVEDATRAWDEDRVRFELFAPPGDDDFLPEPFDIHIASSGASIHVAADQSALEALRDAGVIIASSCELGVCGSCECGYSEGVVIHRDRILRANARQNRLLLCVSRARTMVTLDL